MTARHRAVLATAVLALIAGTVPVAPPALAAGDPTPTLAGDPASVADPSGSIHALTGDVLDLTGDVLDLTLSTESLDRSIGVASTGPRTTVLLAADVLFAFGKADLTPAAQARIAEAADDLRRARATGVVTVGGHTDHVGTAADNQDLSARRARAVVAALTPLVAGLEVTLTPRAYGFTRPLVPERTAAGADDPAARARNRRVEITFTAPAP